MWRKGAVIYPIQAEPITQTAAPTVDFFDSRFNYQPRRNLLRNNGGVSVFSLPQWAVPNFDLSRESIQFKRKYTQHNQNLTSYDLTPPATIYLDWLGTIEHRLRRLKSNINSISQIPYNIVAPPVINLDWQGSIIHQISRKKSLNLYNESRRNYVPIVAVVPNLSWNSTFPQWVWRRKLPIALIPYKDNRDVSYFINPEPPFDPNARLVAIVNIAEGWDTHFSSRSWASIQDQIDAGYPLYCQPTLATGYYEEIVDFDSIFENTIVGLTFNTEAVQGVVSCQPYLSVSDDGISYSPYEPTTQLFAASCRFVKFKLDFTSGNDTNVAYFRNIQITLSVRRETDQGRVDCLASDTGGTTVLFNKAFRDVESITATPSTTSTYYTVIDFVDAPDPTEFKVLVYDLAGNRVNATVDWIARGIT